MFSKYKLFAVRQKATFNIKDQGMNRYLTTNVITYNLLQYIISGIFRMLTLWSSKNLIFISSIKRYKHRFNEQFGRKAILLVLAWWCTFAKSYLPYGVRTQKFQNMWHLLLVRLCLWIINHSVAERCLTRQKDKWNTTVKLITA